MITFSIFLFFVIFVECKKETFVCDPKPGTPTLTPYGKPFGVQPGRVTWYYSNETCTWTGDESTLWWDPKYVNQDNVDEMLSKTLQHLTGEKADKDSWDALFKDFNKRKFDLENTGYQPGDKIAIKVNLNTGVGTYHPTFPSNSFSPQFFKSLISQLVNNAGVPQEDITAFDAARWFQAQFYEEPTGIGSDFPNVNFVDNVGGMPYVRKVEADNSTMMYFSNRFVASWNTTKLPKCLTAAKYVIQLNAFRGHQLAGFTESGKSWFGSVYRPDLICNYTNSGYWCPASLHKFVNITGRDLSFMGGGWLPRQRMGEYNALVDLLGHDDTAQKGLVFFTDGLYGGTFQESFVPPVKFEMTPFNGDWSCSIFASQDPIALDSVNFDFLRNEPAIESFSTDGCADNYLHEASKLPFPPSGIHYAPSGEKLDSLGVHEHWNNEKDKEYSRNLKRARGIELLKLHEMD